MPAQDPDTEPDNGRADNPPRGRSEITSLTGQTRYRRFARKWLFYWLSSNRSIFEKILLPVETAGFESATP
jgi:hypothetical protein